MQSLVTDKPPELVKERNLRPKRKLEDGVTALDTGSKRQKASVRPQTEPPNHDKREDGIPGSRARRGVAGAQEPAADVASKHTDEAVSLTTAAQVEGSLAGTVLTLRGAPAIVSPGTSKVLEGSRPKPVKESLPGRAKKQKVLAGETDPAAVPDTVSGAKPGSLPDERAIKRATRGQRHAPTPVSELPGGADSQTAGKGSLTNKGQPVRQQVRRLAARESLFASGSSGRGAQGRNKVERAAGGGDRRRIASGAGAGPVKSRTEGFRAHRTKTMGLQRWHECLHTASCCGSTRVTTAGRGGQEALFEKLWRPPGRRCPISTAVD